MSLHCHCEGMDDSSAEWWYDRYAQLDTFNGKRSTHCRSCRYRLKPGAQVYRFTRWRDPNSDIEERIHGDEVPLAPWYHCLDCQAIYVRLEQIGVCVDLGDDMREILDEFNRDYAPRGFSLKVNGSDHDEQ
ncbi:hypothetical protein AB4090_08260 [Acidithiobacillus sp. IBUN Pt1247-S3]|uniref:hypothetical protein n=1 Tax=Acidithiobacillus sp. IBUN Pt1247-S3 TaxID=3166642 RepID=UPI0034E39921